MNAAKVELGRYLFFDRRLSGNQTASCGTCHRPALAFTDGRTTAIGSTGDRHRRNTMSLANVAYNPQLTWVDPSVASLEEQMLTPMFSEHPVELGLAGHEQRVLEQLQADADYRRRFADAFPGEEPASNFGQIVRAIASFERTLLSADSAYDRWLLEDDDSAISEGARRGAGLFFSERLACAECHAGLTFSSGPVVGFGREESTPPFHNTNLYSVYPLADTGLVEHTGRTEDRGRFRAPTLRNIALTAPYMHDGSIATLDEVVEHYARGGRAHPPHPERSSKVKGFAISAAERSDVVAFLEALTDEGFIADPRFQDPWRTELK